MAGLHVRDGYRGQVGKPTPLNARHERLGDAGVASNVKANSRIRLLPGVDDVFVYPHMGDGGLAVGAALLAVAEDGSLPRKPVADMGWGPAFSDEVIEEILKQNA